MKRAWRSMLTDPDRRYWRLQRGNRRVRKARRGRAALRAAAEFAPQVALVLLLVAAALPGLRRLVAAPEFALQRIEVRGALRTQDDAVRERLRPWIGKSLLDLDLDALAAEVAGERWVRRAAVKRILPDAVRVELSERVPAALAVLDGNPHVVDTTGWVIGPSGLGLSDDLPLLTGLDGLSRSELIAALGRGVAALARLRRSAEPWMAEVAELDLSAPDRVVLRTVGSQTELYLDPHRVERNLPRWLALRPSIEETLGPLVYADLRWSDRITTKPVQLPINPEGR